MTRSQNWFDSFKNALAGCSWAFKTQRNFKVHLVISFLVLTLAFWLPVPSTQLLILVGAIVFGLTVEMANTAFEKTVDLITEKYTPLAKIVKDVAAGMMLITAIGLALIGWLILFPLLWQKLS